MLDRPGVLQTELERLYQRSDSDDVDLGRFLAEHDVAADDDAIAELIEMDGRLRITRGRAVDLDRYLGAIANLPERDVPLDAAIDVTLRAMSRSGRADEASIRTLIDRYPTLEAAIRDAGVLSEALVSTAGLRADLDEGPARPLPSDFGPRLDTGRARYELRELLGEGAFGQVYLAVDRQLSEPGHAALVAIKILAARGRTARSRERLADEATKARRVDHANVVRVVDRGVTAGDEDYIVHEYVDGGDLSDWLDQQPGAIPPRQAAELVASIARGVQAAHAAGLVHCDLKPGNIMLTHDGVPKVADFGIAARLDEAAGELPAPLDEDRPLGNLAFIAPEQYRREDGATNTPADIYALGGVLYRLLTGHLPNGSTVGEIARTHDPENGREHPPPPSETVPGIDLDLDQICQRAMAIAPQDRYASAASLADDLESWLRREPIPWTRPTKLRILRLWTRRKPGLATVCGLLGLSVVVGGVAGFMWWSHAQWESGARAVLTTFISQMRALNAAGKKPITEIFAGIWAIEEVLGPQALGAPGERADVWQARVEVIRRALDEAAKSGRRDDLTSHFLEAQLGLWLVRDGDYAEAEPLLAANRDYWRRLLPEDDVWLDAMDALIAGAAVNRLAADGADGGLSPDTRGEALAVETNLLSLRGLFETIGHGQPVHHIILNALVSLYGPDLLDRPDAAAAIVAEIDELLDLTERQKAEQERLRRAQQAQRDAAAAPKAD